MSGVTWERSKTGVYRADIDGTAVTIQRVSGSNAGAGWHVRAGEATVTECWSLAEAKRFAVERYEDAA